MIWLALLSYFFGEKREAMQVLAERFLLSSDSPSIPSAAIQ
ncbi:hypothetical protein [Perlucidibaca aquatica]|nr:hypothetical protein [Perlucidibaca aquatica]